jgi:hypothetical protein
VYGVPPDLDLNLFVGATLVQIALGEYQVQFRFQVGDGSPRRPDPYLSVEGHWELADESGHIIDRAEPNSDRDAYRLHRLLGKEVASTRVDPPRSFTLRFNSGLRLQVFDDSEEFESFSIQPGDIYV